MAESKREAEERFGVSTFWHTTGAELIVPELPKREGKGGILLTESHLCGGNCSEVMSPKEEVRPEDDGDCGVSQREMSEGSA